MGRGWAYALPLAAGGCLGRHYDADYTVAPLNADTAATAELAKGPEREAVNARQPLEVDPSIPGGKADTPQLPPADKNKPDERGRAIDRLFPTPAPMPEFAKAPAGSPHFTLADLQGIAAKHHPQLRQAAADIDAARGAALQAGLPPNPSIGYETDTFGSGRTAGQQGGKLEQTVKVAGKLQLARLAAEQDVRAAEVALRAAQIEVATRVRTAYFNYLVARTSLDINTRLSEYLDELVSTEVKQLRAGENAVHEPLQARALAADARATVVQSRVKLRSAWRQLAAQIGQPDLPPADVIGTSEIAPPAFDHAEVRERVLRSHPDAVTAEIKAGQARIKLRLAEVQPIPDIAVKVVVQKDFTTPPFGVSGNLEVGVPVPAFDRNQGNIKQSHGQLGRAVEEVAKTRLDLSAKLADAYERYEGNRALVETYREQVLPDLVRAYRSLYERYKAGDEDLNFSDVVVAEQLIDTNLATYLTNLAAQWVAVVDIASLLQTDELYAPDGKACPTPASVLPLLPPPRKVE